MTAREPALFPLENGATVESDKELEQVAAWIRAQPDWLHKIGWALRDSVDFVLDGVRTRRWDLQQCADCEKTVVGVKAEYLLLNSFGLRKTEPLDTVIDGIPVDIKCTIGHNWMIPPEAVDHICILLQVHDQDSWFSAGLIRAKDEWLTSGNRDKKRRLSKKGRAHIFWLVRGGALPENVILQMGPESRSKVMKGKSGKARIAELFRQVVMKPVPAAAVDTVASQRDNSRRVRQAREVLEEEGELTILQGHWKADRADAKRVGVPIRKDVWVSVSLRYVQPRTKYGKRPANLLR